MKLFTFIFACILTTSSFGQTNDTHYSKKIEGNLIHNVFFWLKNPDNLEERKVFEKGVKELLNNCEFITASHFGKPANTAKRPVIDASFTYCIVLTFKSKEAHDKYQVNPLHEKFIKECKDLWNKVLVYDSKPL